MLRLVSGPHASRSAALLALVALAGCDLLTGLDGELSAVTIQGRAVVEATQQPVTNARVTVFRLTPDGFDFDPLDQEVEAGLTLTGADGRFTVRDDPGQERQVRYRVIAEFCPGRAVCEYGRVEVVVSHPELGLTEGERCTPDGAGGCLLDVTLPAASVP